MAIKRGSKVNAGYSMASMTDIVFLLLIFFLITSTLVSPNALQLLLPKSNSQAPAKSRISVSIKHLGQDKFEYYVGSDPVTYSSLEAKIQSLMTPETEPMIALYADKSVPIEQAVNIMNIAARNKYRLILATAPE